MNKDEARRMLGVEPPLLRLPVQSRNPSRIVRRLRPVEALGGYWLLVCRGLGCRLCGFPEEPRVVVERRLVDDVLSGLRHRVPEVRVECCGRILGVGRWTGSMINLDGLECPVEGGGGGWRCWGRPCSGPRECLDACRATRGP